MSQAEEIFKKHALACAKELTEVVYLPKAKEFVSKTPNAYDDVFLGAIEPIIREALEKDFLKRLLPTPKITGAV